MLPKEKQSPPHQRAERGKRRLSPFDDHHLTCLFGFYVHPVMSLLRREIVKRGVCVARCRASIALAQSTKAKKRGSRSFPH